MAWIFARVERINVTFKHIYFLIMFNHLFISSSDVKFSRHFLLTGVKSITHSKRVWSFYHHTMHSFYNEDNNLSHQNIHFDKAKQKWWSTNSICYYIRKGHKKHQRWHFNSGLINMLQFLNRGTFDPITHPVFSLWHHILQDATWLLARLEITLQRQVGWLAAARLEACHLLQSDSVELEVCGKHWANPTLVFVLRWKTNQKSLEEEMLRLRVLLQETESV